MAVGLVTCNPECANMFLGLESNFPLVSSKLASSCTEDASVRDRFGQPRCIKLRLPFDFGDFQIKLKDSTFQIFGAGFLSLYKLSV